MVNHIYMDGLWMFMVDVRTINHGGFVMVYKPAVTSLAFSILCYDITSKSWPHRSGNREIPANNVYS